MSTIAEAIEGLKQAILAEMNEMSKKHRETLNEMTSLKTAVSEAAEILHGVPRLGELGGTCGTTRQTLEKIDKKIERAWDLLDKARVGSTA